MLSTQIQNVYDQESMIDSVQNLAWVKKLFTQIHVPLACFLCLAIISFLEEIR